MILIFDKITFRVASDFRLLTSVNIFFITKSTEEPKLYKVTF